MKITLKTEALKNATAKALKGAGNLSMLAITSAIGIELINGDLVLTTTDNTTNLAVMIKNAVTGPAENFYACTNAELFCKLISKQSCEKITLDLQDTCLQVEGDGIYNLSLIQDEEGGMGRILPIDVDGLAPINVDVKELKKMLKFNKLAVSKLYDEPMYTGYCTNKNKVYTYNGNDACISDVDLKNINVLLPSKLVDLFDLFEDKTVTILSASDRIKVSSNDVVITGTVLEGISEYPIEPLNGTVYSEQFAKTVKVRKDKLSAVLDRLSLFVSNEDQNAIQLNFTETALLLANSDSNACESVSYVDTPKAELSSVFVDLNDLKLITNAIDTENITIIYGSDSAIGVCTDTMRFILPLLSDDETDETEEITEEEESKEETNDEA